LKKANLLKSASMMAKADTARLSRLIRQSGFYNLKAERLKNLLTFLSDKYGFNLNKISNIRTDDLRAQLLGVNGVGPETCDSILLYAFNRPVFVIDAYTKRIFSRHKILPRDCSYDQAQNLFMRNLSPDHRLYNEFHALIVRLAKDFCKIRPDCVKCPLYEKKLACK
ncbi:MAG: endonuclease III domain-containing protein, partial [Candidatus Omnitrophota bacterium]